MPTPAEWNVWLARHVPWDEAYAKVEEHARNVLSNVPAEDPMGTTELVERLYPEAHCRTDGIEARKRIFNALYALGPRSMADCATKGEERTMRGYGGRRTIRPWLWHMPGTPNRESVETSRRKATQDYERKTRALWLHSAARLGYPEAERIFKEVMAANPAPEVAP